MTPARSPPPPGPDAATLAALAGLDLGRPWPPRRIRRLEGGVSSDIWLLEFATGAVCVKRALPKLRVEADWRAPVGRNAAEAAWLRWAGARAPGSAPRVLAEDRAAGILAMEYLAPDRHPVWKAELMAGRVDGGLAAAFGALLARLHAASVDDAGARGEEFRNGATFHAIRVEPYLLHPLAAHPDLEAPLRAMADALDADRTALVHGDASPKNVLVRPDGAPLLLDAECATLADPAFDLAFCLNHLLLKARVVPRAGGALGAAAAALRDAYFAGCAWEDPAGLDARAARLLAGLMLGRVDGRSPVEYLDTEELRAPVRAFARARILDPAPSLAALGRAWREVPGGAGG